MKNNIQQKGFTPTPVSAKSNNTLFAQPLFSRFFSKQEKRETGVSLSYKRGFTLIELLVVIAIIGILSSVILASLNAARAKGANAAIQSGLANMRAQGELYYEDNNMSYASICTSTQFQSMLDAATSTSGANGACQADRDYWTASAPLKVAINNKNYWCVDSAGDSMAVSANITSTSSCQ